MASSQPEWLGEDLQFLRKLLQELTHEIAAPLTPLFGHLDLLELRSAEGLSPNQDRCVQAMRRSLRRLNAINDCMLELARVERGHIPCERVPLAPAQVLSEVIRRHSEVARERQIGLVERLDVPADRKVLADWNLLVIAVGHLVENALRYAPAGSAVTLSLGEEAGLCALAVNDRGRGLPGEEHRQVIRPFYRIADQDGYTETAGLGLTIAALIARRHEGELQIRPGDVTADPQGLTAAILLPWLD